jgi:hypothetical protein
MRGVGQQILRRARDRRHLIAGIGRRIPVRLFLKRRHRIRRGRLQVEHHIQVLAEIADRDPRLQRQYDGETPVMLDRRCAGKIGRRVDAKHREIGGGRPVEGDCGQPLPLHQRIEHRLIPVENESRHAGALRHAHGKTGLRRFGLDDALRLGRKFRVFLFPPGFLRRIDPCLDFLRQRRRIARPARRQQIDIERVFGGLGIEREFRGQRKPERTAVLALPHDGDIARHLAQKDVGLDIERPVEIENENARIDRGAIFRHTVGEGEDRPAIAVFFSNVDADAVGSLCGKRQCRQQQREHGKAQDTAEQPAFLTPARMSEESVHAHAPL